MFADVIKANGVAVSNRVDLPDSAVIYEVETPIFRNSPLVRKAVEELAEMDGSSESFVSRLDFGDKFRLSSKVKPDPPANFNCTKIVFHQKSSSMAADEERTPNGDDIVEEEDLHLETTYIPALHNTISYALRSAGASRYAFAASRSCQNLTAVMIGCHCESLRSNLAK